MNRRTLTVSKWMVCLQFSIVSSQIFYTFKIIPHQRQFENFITTKYIEIKLPRLLFLT